MKLMFFLGTRPEVIKLAPAIWAAKSRGHDVHVVCSGQHGHEMLDPLFHFFKVKPSFDLKVMRPGQSLPMLSSRLLGEFEQNLSGLKPDFILVQGDTTTALLGGYWGFLHKIPVAHVEAGLRTYDLHQPFPEEANRQLLSRLTDVHFAPTKAAGRALSKEGIPSRKIRVVGNTAIDALQYTLSAISERPSENWLAPELERWIGDRRLILITSHRRENFGSGLERICDGILKLMESSDDLCGILPVHPNPNVKSVFEQRLGGHARLRLVPPLPYTSFVYMMKRASLLLTDSGGIQEEGPTLKKPILVMRKTTERPEGVRLGFSELVGADAEKIYKFGVRALRKGCRGRGANPYGDGKTSLRIIKILESWKPRP